MAVMYPSSIEAYNYTNSEKYFYEALKNQLSDEYKVFYSVRWFKKTKENKELSECDFLVFHPNYGFITIEVKGGVDITIQENEWMIKDTSNSKKYRPLRRSPFEQAQESMYYFHDYYEDMYSTRYQGVYGFAVAFPFYRIEQDLGVSYPQFLTLDCTKMNDLEPSIRKIFNYWRNRNNCEVPFYYDQQEKFINMVNKRIALSAAAGALIDLRNKELEKVNQVQNSYIDFISNYHRAFIIGGAGTGKTWLGIKKALVASKEGKKVIIVTPGEILCDYIRQQLNVELIQVKAFKELNESDMEQYECVIVDEAQDFNQKQANYIVRLLQDEESILYVLYDDNQNIRGERFKDKFNISIKTPPFILNTNIRNTSQIYNWCTHETGIGREVRPNIIEGVVPEKIVLNNEREAVLKVEELLNTLVEHQFVQTGSITILSNKPFEESILKDYPTLGQYSFNYRDIRRCQNEIVFQKNEQFKGLESDIIICINDKRKEEEITPVCEYIAYTRARFYLYIIELVD